MKDIRLASLGTNSLDVAHDRPPFCINLVTGPGELPSQRVKLIDLDPEMAYIFVAGMFWE